jgi:hypothetical protein
MFAQQVQGCVLCTVVYRRAVEQILVDGEYGLLKRSRLQLTLHNPGREVRSSSSSYT